MPGRRTHTEDCFWLLGSLCNLYRIPFDAALVASQFPPPYTLATFHEAARALGFKTGAHPLPSDGWDKLSFPCIAFLKGEGRGEGDTPVLLLKTNHQQLLYFRPNSQTPATLSIATAYGAIATTDSHGNPSTGSGRTVAGFAALAQEARNDGLWRRAA